MGTAGPRGSAANKEIIRFCVDDFDSCENAGTMVTNRMC